MEIFEYRGISDLVYAEVLTDNNEDGYTTGTVKELAGVAEIGKSTESSSDTKYYDNIPALVISSTGPDTINIKASALDIETTGDITGQKYDSTTGALIEGDREPKYFAIGYKTEKTNGDIVYVWRYKGQFAIPDENHKSKDKGTDGEGQTLVYTGVTTRHKFTKNNGKGAKALVVDLGKDKADVSTFFDKVTTPDELKAKG